MDTIELSSHDHRQRRISTLKLCTLKEGNSLPFLLALNGESVYHAIIWSSPSVVGASESTSPAISPLPSASRSPSASVIGTWGRASLLACPSVSSWKTLLLPGGCGLRADLLRCNIQTENTPTAFQKGILVVWFPGDQLGMRNPKRNECEAK